MGTDPTTETVMGFVVGLEAHELDSSGVSGSRTDRWHARVGLATGRCHKEPG